MAKHLYERPRLGPDGAREIAARHFGHDGTATELVSDRDQNFRIDAAAGSFVLKIANGGESRAALELQNALLRRLDDLPTAAPRLVASAAGGDIVTVEHGEATHQVRLLTWVEGTPMAQVRPRGHELLEDLGRLVGRMRAALADFDHPAAGRTFHWDLCRGPALLAERLERIHDPSQREILNDLLARYERHTQPYLSELRRGVLHNDLNDHNVLVGPLEGDRESPARRITGLIDVGDALEGWVVADLAVAIAYALLGRSDLLGAARAITAACHAEFPLTDDEIAALPGLIGMRLALSVANAADQATVEPDNDYLTVSAAPAWECLERLAAVEPRLAHYHLRAACGLEPCPAGGRLRDWLGSTKAEFAGVVDAPLSGADVHVFDLRMGSTEMGVGAPGDFVTSELSERLFGQMRAAGRAVGIGRYDEVRSWYGGALFTAPGDEAPRRRTVHVGVDVFLEGGAPVRAPLAGTIVSASVNEGRLDYGPTLILEHEPEPGLTFWTLYGHLTPDSLDDVPEGQTVAAGERIAAIGDFPGNGDWPPHLHFQLIADRLDFVTDFPGVCAPEEREVWKSLSPDPARLLGLDAAQVAPVGMTAAGIAERRRQHLGPSLSLSYRRPLHIVRGYRQYLYDAAGQPFLDAVNNVPHVGHSHPRVVAAAAAQNAVLNTNTRYLHENIVRYAERLVATLPDPLEVCFFVCSGSEANELALRLARTVTGRHDVVSLEGAYHGHTSALIDISPYKHDGPGGRGAPEWAHVAALPDPYRGRHADTADPAARYADEVRRACEAAAERGGAAAFIAEPLLGCGGQIVPPDGYLRQAFDRARQHGALCIADEVQIGFGRVGTHMWAFEAQGATPDILTLGKPIGNGYPMAAVVTTRAIADAFANGMEFFTTFGGNPVACAVGMAVLDVVEAEGLQDNALHTGQALLHGLRELAARHPALGDVRGAGLYVGAELVSDPESRTPAPAAAAYVANRVRDHHVLISTDGPQHNVLKVKPPLCFDGADSERLLTVLDTVLGEDGFAYALQEPSKPT